jgi:hypothetical protein
MPLAGMVDDDSSGAANDLSQKLKKSRVEIADSDRYIIRKIV